MAKPTMDPLAFLRNLIEEAEPDVLREMVKSFAQTLMSAEASAIAGAAYGEHSDERLTRRDGYRIRRWDTRTGSIDLRIPKLRAGSYFPGLAARVLDEGLRRCGGHGVDFADGPGELE